MPFSRENLMRKVLVLFFVMFLGAISASSQTTPKESLLVLSKRDHTLASVDPASGKVDFVLGSGQNRTHMIFVTQDLSKIFTSNIQSGTVSIWEKVRPSLPSGPPPAPGAPPTGAFPPEWSQALVEVGAGSEGFDVTPDGKELWAANAQAGTIAVVNIA